MRNVLTNVFRFANTGLVLGVSFLAISPGAAKAAVISGDSINNVSGGTTIPISGDTQSTNSSADLYNPSPVTFTGQTGQWNGLNLGSTNSQTNSYTSGLLTDSTGAATTVQWLMGRPVNPAYNTWRNNAPAGLSTSSSALRLEGAYLYYPTLTSSDIPWEFTGLTPNTAYNLIFYGAGNDGHFSNTANSVSGTVDAVGDWYWSSLTSDANGNIIGDWAVTTSNNDTSGSFYGFQIGAASAAPEPSSLALLALGAVPLLRRRRLA